MSQENLVSQLIRDRRLKTPLLTEIFLSIDRKDFVMPDQVSFAYEDRPLPLIRNSTISQPTTVAIMFELLQPQMNEKILDVGSGSGWTTALLAEAVGSKGKVFGLEIHKDLVNLGSEHIKKYGFKNVKLLKADPKRLGLAKEAPFDKILVSAAAPDVPHDLISQLKIGGIMVIPILNSIFKITRLNEDEVEAQEYPGFSFVPLVSS